MTDATTPDADASRANRRRFLKGLGALSIVGLAGCGGDGDTDTPTDTDDGMTPTPTDAATDSGTTTEPGTTTDPVTTTEPEGGTIPGDDPATLLSFDETPVVDAGGSTTVSGTVTNPYLFDLVGGEITIEPPGNDWDVSPVGGATIDDLPSQGSRSAEWEVSVPESAGGEALVDVTVSYASSTDETETGFEQPIVVVTPVGEAPMGIDCGGCHLDNPVMIDGLTFRPAPETREEVQFDSGSVKPVPEEKRWWSDVGVSVDPAPNSSTNGQNPDFDGTQNDQLHEGEWWADGQFTVAIEIENGTYDVVLHNAEYTNAGEDGARVHSASVNGETAYEELDMNADVGPETAFTRAVEGLEVTDGEITIDLEASVNNPKLSAIEIREA